MSSGSNSNTTLDTVSLSAGTCILIGEAEFPSSATGVRHLVWYNGSSVVPHSRVTIRPASGMVTRIQSIAIVSVNSGETASMTLQCFHTIGSKQTVSWNWRYVRIA